jgi:hypothetical protein
MDVTMDAFAATRFRYRRTIFFAPSSSRQARRRFKSNIYLFTDHSFRSAPGAVATLQQFHYPAGGACCA